MAIDWLKSDTISDVMIVMINVSDEIKGVGVPVCGINVCRKSFSHLKVTGG